MSTDVIIYTNEITSLLQRNTYVYHHISVGIYDSNNKYPLTFIQKFLIAKSHGKMFWKEREYQHQRKVERSVVMNAHERSNVWSGIPLASISVWRRNTCESEDVSFILYSPYA